MGDEIKMDMSQEKAPARRRRIIPEGWRTLKFTAGEQRKAKSGNNMIVLETLDVEANLSNEEFFVIEPGKRWKLKSLLDALCVPGGEDGNYSFKMSDIIGKSVAGLSEWKDNVYINRNGEEIKEKKHEIIQFKEVVLKDVELGWDDELPGNK